MLGFIEIIFSIIGFYGALSNNTILMIIGLVSIIICDFIDIFITGHNSTTILICIILGIGASIANKDPLYTFTILLCGENLITCIFGLFLMLISLIFKKEENNINRTLETPKDIMNDYERVLRIIDGNEKVNSDLFIGSQNPYTGEIVSNYDDIILYFKMFKLDCEGKNPLSIK